MEKNDIRLVLPKKLYDQIEEDAVKLHMELELSIPVKPSEIAKRLGYVVKRFSELQNERVDVSELRKGKDGCRRDGLSYYDPNKHTYVIWINDLDTVYEEHNDFTIMHEIGHIRRGHRGDSQLAEMVANYYAAYAMVPSPLPGIFKCSNYIQIADVFGVSIDCAYNCFSRTLNWSMYSGKLKSYEKELIDYYKNLVKGGKCL